MQHSHKPTTAYILMDMKVIFYNDLALCKKNGDRR